MSTIHTTIFWQNTRHTYWAGFSPAPSPSLIFPGHHACVANTISALLYHTLLSVLCYDNGLVPHLHHHLRHILAWHRARFGSGRLVVDPEHDLALTTRLLRSYRGAIICMIRYLLPPVDNRVSIIGRSWLGLLPAGSNVPSLRAAVTWSSLLCRSCVGG